MESSEQHGRSGTSSPWQNSFMVAPTTSYPCSTSSAAATDESTPPDIATSTRVFILRHRMEAARLAHELREHFAHAIAGRFGAQRAERHTNCRADELARNADGRQHVRRSRAAALTCGAA